MKTERYPVTDAELSLIVAYDRALKRPTYVNYQLETDTIEISAVFIEFFRANRNYIIVKKMNGANYKVPLKDITVHVDFSDTSIHVWNCPTARPAPGLENVRCNCIVTL